MSDEKPVQGLTRKDLFLGLIHSFQAAAMQQMGKVPSPFSGQVERDLEQARLSIDMLEMLEERTSGNLTGEESRFLKHVLTELRLNYVSEVEDESKAKGSQQTPPLAPSPQAPAPQAPQPQDTPTNPAEPAAPSSPAESAAPPSPAEPAGGL